MTDDLRARVRAAISATATLRGLDGPERTELATVPLDIATDAVMAVLDQEFPPPLIVDFGETTLSPEQIAEWTRVFNEAQTGPLRVLPPNAPEIWRRRTPAERRAYLEAHRTEAIERGVPGDLIDLMIQDAEADS